MKFDFLYKQASRREMLQGSTMLAGSAFLAHLFPRRSSRRCDGQRATSIFAGRPTRDMRAKFNAVPWKRKSSLTMSLCSTVPAEL